MSNCISSDRDSFDSESTSGSQLRPETEQERYNRVFASSIAATRRAIMNGQCTAAEIRTFEQQTGITIDPHHHDNAKSRAPSYQLRVAHLSESPKKRKRSSSSNEADSTTLDLDIVEETWTRSRPPSKRPKAASERKPRKFEQRSTKAGCVPICISKDSHAHKWGTQKEVERDMDAFREFVDDSLHPCNDNSRSVTGKQMQAAYAAYCDTFPDAMKLSPNIFGYCCARMFCKGNPSNVVKYYGVILG